MIFYYIFYDILNPIFYYIFYDILNPMLRDEIARSRSIIIRNNKYKPITKNLV